MRKAFEEVLCIRGRGAFQKGVCYPIVGGEHSGIFAKCGYCVWFSPKSNPFQQEEGVS